MLRHSHPNPPVFFQKAARPGMRRSRSGWKSRVEWIRGRKFVRSIEEVAGRRGLGSLRRRPVGSQLQLRLGDGLAIKRYAGMDGPGADRRVDGRRHRAEMSDLRCPAKQADVEMAATDRQEAFSKLHYCLASMVYARTNWCRDRQARDRGSRKFTAVVRVASPRRLPRRASAFGMMTLQ
jgi:hypothetical protein